MEKVLDHHMQSDWHTSLTNNYRFWKYNRSKFQQWVNHRHKQTKLDIWDQYIVRNKLDGQTVVYDSQAIFWKDVNPNCLIVENWAPAIVSPYVTLLDATIDHSLQNQVSNLVLYRPLSCKLTTSMFDYLTKPTNTRSGMTPCLINWLAPQCKIFWSIGQEFFAFNRLRMTLLDFIDLECNKIESKFGLKLVLKTHSASDYVNGHVKLVLQRS